MYICTYACALTTLIAKLSITFVLRCPMMSVNCCTVPDLLLGSIIKEIILEYILIYLCSFLLVENPTSRSRFCCELTKQ